MLTAAASPSAASAAQLQAAAARGLAHMTAATLLVFSMLLLAAVLAVPCSNPERWSSSADAAAVRVQERDNGTDYDCCNLFCDSAATPGCNASRPPPVGWRRRFPGGLPGRPDTVTSMTQKKGGGGASNTVTKGGVAGVS